MRKAKAFEPLRARSQYRSADGYSKAIEEVAPWDSAAHSEFLLIFFTTHLLPRGFDRRQNERLSH